jgi:hypothetical protein
MSRAALSKLAATTALLLAGGGISGTAAADDLPRLDERTALMLGANRLKIGILSFDYGVIERLSFGTDPPPWAARAFLPVIVPNLHLKFAVLQRDPVHLTVQGAGYFVALQDQGSASGNLTAFPASVFASFRLQPKVWLHSELTYIWVRAWGAGDLNDAGLAGQAVTRAAQAGAMFELRLTRIFSITARGRYQFYAGPIAFDGSSSLDPYTTVTVRGQAEPRVSHPWEAVAGVAFLWRHVHLLVGAGYGYYFVPGIDLAYPKRGFVPDASLSFIL